MLLLSAYEVQKNVFECRNLNELYVDMKDGLSVDW